MSALPTIPAGASAGGPAPAWTVRVRFFAGLREALGDEAQVQVPPGSTVASLRAQLQAQSTTHAEVLAPQRAVRAALNQRMCQGDEALSDGAEVAFFPPVTGG